LCLFIFWFYKLVYVWEVKEKKDQTPSKSALCLNLLCMDTLVQEDDNGYMQHEKLQLLIFKRCHHHPRVGDNNYTFDYLVIMHCSHFVVAHMIKV
jgi:hypothetical protein